MRRELAAAILDRGGDPPLTLLEHRADPSALDLLHAAIERVRRKGATTVVVGIVSFGRSDWFEFVGNSFEISHITARLAHAAQKQLDIDAQDSEM